MFALFALFGLAMTLCFLKKRRLAITVVLITLFFTLLMFMHHATDVLKINL